MPQSYLVVPMELDALVVNQGVLNRDTFRWWQFNYLSLNHYKSPEPLALDRSVGGPAQGVYLHWTLPEALRHGTENPQTGDIEYPLVPNRWMIVRFGGTQQRTVTGGWVIESDCPKTSQATVDTSFTSMYLIDPTVVQTWLNSKDPFRNSFTQNTKPNQPQIANIGIPFPLNQGGQSWSERAPDTMFLTAVAPGNHAFSIYYPHNTGVFSFYDNLSGIDNDTLSYLVVGWYSNPQKDILASWPQDTSSKQPYQDLLANLRWTVAGDSTEQATASLYEGMVFSLGWQRSGNPPGTVGQQPQTDPLQKIRDSGLLNVGLGNTTIDALCALVAQQFKTKGHDPQTVKLLEAFQYGLLPVINEVNGDALLEEKIRQAWHGSKPGGYSWTIVAKESDGSVSTDLSDDEAAWLLQLNTDQSALDDALIKLYDLQWNLNATWYRLGFLSDSTNTFPKPPAGVTNLNQYKAQLSAQLNATNPVTDNSLVNQVLGQITKVQGLMSRVPQPDWSKTQNSQDAFQAGIEAFAGQRKLSAEKVLKAVTGPRYWKANNPVIIISGVESSQAIDPNASLQVRLTSGLITGFNAGAGHPVNQTTVGSIIPMPGNLSNLPPPVAAIVQEYFFLDPAGASSIAATIKQPLSQVTSVMTGHNVSDYQGTLPGLNLGLWSQPWNPMYVEWQVNYTYIPYLTNNQPSWTFDGTDYHFTPGSGSPVLDPPRDIGGISLFSPHAQFVFGSRLKEFVDKYGSETEMENLFDWINEIDQWKFLSQELVGFNELLALRDERAFRSPSAQDMVKANSSPYPVADLIGYEGIAQTGKYSLPDSYRGQVNSFPFFPTGPKIPFHGVRQGQIYFENLYLYDKFGRILYVIQAGQQSGLYDMKNFPLIRDEALYPDTQLNTNIAAVAQLPPRALQFSRLDFDLIDGKDDTKILGVDAGVNPIAGWVLPNHLDNSILIFAPDGTSLGEFRLLVNDQGIKVGRWQAPPHSNINSLADVGQAAPHLLQMLDAAQIKDEQSFQAFLDVIDSTLWTIDPLGSRADQNLSVLIGRPLALVRARLQLSLEGPAIKDTGWDVALNPPAPDFLNYKFAVRLGDQATRQDGVIGYFAGDNYSVFNSVAATQTMTSQSYVKQIGPPGATTGGNYIQLQFNETGDGSHPTSQAYISLLADPRADIHATTGIVPVKQINIPAGFVESALANMEISFRIGPVLTAIQPTPSESAPPPQYPNSISYPAPAEQNGQWSWWENAAGSPDWNGYALLYTTPNAQFQSLPNTLRDGLLQLVLNLNKTS
jgi:hypothetical protein